MRVVAFCALLLALGNASATTQCRPQAEFDPPILQPLAAGVWRVAAARGEASEANRGATVELVVVRDRKRLWLVGSGPSPAFGIALACAIERTLGGAVTDVVNTRAAPELAMGNVAFGRARRWALPDVIATMRQRCESCRARLALALGAAGTSLRPELIRVPDRPVDDRGVAAGRLGPFTTVALERAPGERVLVLRHRASGVVIAQGLLWAGAVPNLRETRGDVMLGSWRELTRFAGGARLIGEQGGAVRAEAIAAHIGYLEALTAAVADALAHGDARAATGAGIDLPSYASLPGYAALHPLNVQRLWRELEQRSFDTPEPAPPDQPGRSATFQRSLR